MCAYNEDKKNDLPTPHQNFGGGLNGKLRSLKRSLKLSRREKQILRKIYPALLNFIKKRFFLTYLSKNPLSLSKGIF